MKKLKVLSAVALAGIATLTLVGCKDDDKPTETTPTVDVETEKSEAVLAYAKTDAVADVTAYKDNAILLLGLVSTDEAYATINTAVTTATAAINAATTTAAIDTATKAFRDAVSTVVTGLKTQLTAAVTTAKDEIDEVAKNGFYINTKDDGSVEALRVYSAAMFDRASSVAELTEMLTEAKEVINNQFDFLLEHSYVQISTPEQLLTLEKDKNYKLANDIDFEKYVDEDGAKIVIDEGSALKDYKGIFNGGGYSIKNYNIAEAKANKRGLLFQTMAEGAEVWNLRFMNCSHIGTQEGIALISGEATKGVFKNIEFNGCEVDAGSKSYAGLLLGRKTIGGVTVDQITVKGNTKTSANYGGGLIGDARDLGDDAVVSFTNLDINMDVNVVGNTGGLLIGRLDADKSIVTVENARIHANMTGSSSKAGLLFDGASEMLNYTCKNVLLSATYGDGITSDMFVGNKYGPTTASNIYYNSDTTDAVLKSDVPVAVTNDVLNAAWYFDTLGLDKSVWVEEADGSVKLKGASSNVVEEGAELLSVEVLSSRAKTYFYFGDTFNADGLVVVGTYKNASGNVIQAQLSTTAVANLGSYSVSADAFNSAAAGTYTINVTASKNDPADTNPDDGQDKWEKTGNYSVTVNTISTINVYAQEANKVFLKGETFNTDGLVVKAVFSNDSTTTADDVETTLHNSEAKTFYTVTSTAYNKDTTGKYTISISATENGTNFTGSYEVEVVDKIDVTGLTSIAVTVDAQATGTTVDLTNKTATFNSVGKALDYLGSLELADSVRKTINIANGSYEEKLTITLPNVTLVGASEEGTILTYGACAGYKYLDESKGNYGTDNSATVIVKAAGFQAKNITFVNSFDYNAETNTSDKQALAIGVYADNAVLFNCSFTGYQDTVQVKSGRAYFEECYIEGFTDFIFGVNCTAYFNKCEIKSLTRNDAKNGGYIVAPKTDVAYTYGFYFNDCDFTFEEGVTEGTVAIARPWGAAGTCVVINSRLGAHISKTAYGEGDKNNRYEDMSGNTPDKANFKEYNNTGDGSIAEPVKGGTFLTAEEAAKITLTELFKADETAGFVVWDAAAALAALKA